MDTKKLIENTPIVEDIINCKEIFWENPQVTETSRHIDIAADIDEADARLRRFAPFIAKMFPEAEDGIIESELREIGKMKAALDFGKETECEDAADIKGRLFLKCDSHLPVSGSVKARGGIYEVLKLAERIAMEEGGLTEEDDYAVLAEPKYRKLFAEHKVAVGSTGNLGLSIGIISATLGFQVTVHMSADARQWKKDMLREKGVTVIEYPDDYEAAVAQGRKEAEADPLCHFVDDENSLDLFEGYAVAGKRLKKQLEEKGITIDETHRMYVYLPCGVGGAPGGVTYGIKKYFGDHAYCFFAEPTHAPCMTLGLATGLKNEISVKDVGIDGKTEADGLAVGRASRLVADAMESRLTGCYTVDDEKLYRYLALLKDCEGIFIEPSACAAFPGLQRIGTMDNGTFPAPDENSVHIIWATGGNMVPEDEKRAYYQRGRAGLTGQQRLEAHARKTLYENNVEQKETVNGMMRSRWAGCSYADKTLSFAFPVQPWQVNRVGNLHGGVMCVAYDITISALARFYAGENFSPTISLDIKYVRPVMVGDVLIVTAKATSTGKRITQITCEAYIGGSGKLASTGAAVHMNVDTVKERK